MEFNLILLFVDQKGLSIRSRKKISLFCNVAIEDVIETIDVKTIYEAPIASIKKKLDEKSIEIFSDKI